jgi:hypothetical protein
MGGEAGDTATLISFEFDLEHADMPKAIRQTIRARKMRFIHVSPLIKLGPKGHPSKYMGIAKTLTGEYF